jgi:hypothetical protein
MHLKNPPPKNGGKAQDAFQNTPPNNKTKKPGRKTPRDPARKKMKTQNHSPHTQKTRKGQHASQTPQAKGGKAEGNGKMNPKTQVNTLSPKYTSTLSITLSSIFEMSASGFRV